MKLYLADTWYFIALLSIRDSHHHSAMALERMVKKTALVATHEGVLTELLAFFAETGAYNRTRAVAYVRSLLGDEGVIVFESNRDLFLAALSLYERRRDKEYSLVDCMSMHVMQAHGITHVLTNDHHFRQEGFEVLSDAP